MSPKPLDKEAADHDVAVILVGINAKDFVQGCLDSLLNAKWRGKTYEAIYIDNGSTDGTCASLAANHPWVKVVENGYNAGFCKAANAGARLAKSRYYYFINDDTIVLEDAIAMLVDFMDSHPDVATTGSRLVYPDGTEQYSGRAFPTLTSSFMGRRSPLTRMFPNAPWVRKYLCKDQLQRGEPFDADWVSAAGQIFRPEDFWRVGGYDETYYYWHEAIICGRLAEKARKVVLHPQSRVIHYEGKGSGKRPYASQRFHIIDFHRGAYRCFCERSGLRSFHPFRLFVGAMLATRAGFKLAIARLVTAVSP
jgi:N-acetylglucosaminyl-diphospho-decaprenol L-rhamnosyltransferase